jgi:hypothetical protein
MRQGIQTANVEDLVIDEDQLLMHFPEWDQTNP